MIFTNDSFLHNILGLLAFILRFPVLHRRPPGLLLLRLLLLLLLLVPSRPSPRPHAVAPRRRPLELEGKIHRAQPILLVRVRYWPAWPGELEWSGTSIPPWRQTPQGTLSPA